MPAKIKIETQDAALSAALQVVIAEAIQSAGFTNTKVKIVMVSNGVEVPGQFARVADINIQAGHERASPRREPPVLEDLRFVVPHPEGGAKEFIKPMIEKNPDLMDRPIVLDGYADVSEKYAEQEVAFLYGK